MHHGQRHSCSIRKNSPLISLQKKVGSGASSQVIGLIRVSFFITKIKRQWGPFQAVKFLWKYKSAHPSIPWRNCPKPWQGRLTLMKAKITRWKSPIRFLLWHWRISLALSHHKPSRCLRGSSQRWTALGKCNAGTLKGASSCFITASSEKKEEYSINLCGSCFRCGSPCCYSKAFFFVSRVCETRCGSHFLA